MPRRSPLVLAIIVAAAVCTIGQGSDDWPPILLPNPSHPSAPRARVFTVNAPVVVNTVAGDGQRNIYLAGHGSATDIPGLARGFQSKPVGPEDAVVIKLNAQGKVLWSTYLGGTERRFCSGEFCDPPPDSASSIAVDAGGNVDGPLYVSEDRGTTWRAARAARVDGLSQVFDLDFDASRKSVYAAIDDIPGVYESLDDGRTWQRDRRARNVQWDPNVRRPSAMAGLAIDRRDPSIRYATSGGDILRHDATSDWQVALPAQESSLVAWFPVETNPHDGTVWSTARGTLAISPDSGRTWTRRPLPILGDTPLRPSAIVFHPMRRDTVYLAANDVWATFDNGESWQSLTSAIPRRPAVASIAIDSMSNILYAGSGAQLGVLRSVDDGRTWESKLPGHRINSLAVDQTRPHLVYAGGIDSDNRPVVYRSADRGETWQRVTRGLDLRSEVTQLLIDPRDSSRVYVGARLAAVPFVARLVTDGPLPGRVRAPGSTGLARSDFASYLGHGNAKAVASTPTGGIVIALEVPQPRTFGGYRIAAVAAVVIDGFSMGAPR